MKLLKSQLLTKASVLALAVSGLVGLQAYPVEAARSDCASPGYFCAWADPNYTGYRGQWYGNSSDWNNNIENKDSSVWNSSTGYVVRVYQYQGYGTYMYCVPKGAYTHNLHYDWGVPYDNGSSHTWNNNC